MTERGNPEVGDYNVGYGRPPKATRFAQGKSGNLRGRPKGSRSIAASLQDALSGKTTLTENGKSRSVSRLDGMLHRLTNAALRGEMPALKLLLFLLEKYSDGPESKIDFGSLLGEDAAILAQALRESLPLGLKADEASNAAYNEESGDADLV